MKKILVIEDSPEYQLMVRTSLESHFDVFFCETGGEAIDLMKNEDFDCFIVDVGLPDMSGFQICNFIKSQKNTSQTPVILLTGKESIEDKTTGFGNGADDYITKPFHLKELLLRVNARVKDLEANLASDKIYIGDCEINFNTQTVLHLTSKSEIELTRIEFKILTYFSSKVDFVISRQQLLDSVWPNNLNISERTIDSHISNLRKKMSNTKCNVVAVHGSGYRFVLLKKEAA